MAQTPPPRPSFADRIFLFGIRAIVFVLAIIVVGSVLIVHGLLVGRLDYVISGAIIIMIGVVIAVAVIRTSFTLITKPYFAVDAVVGKSGRALVAVKANGKGAVHVEHETWSCVADEPIARGDWIVVTAVEPDKVTLRVRKGGP